MRETADVALRRVFQALLLTGLVILGGAVGYHALGHGRWTFSDTLYMSLISVSTVGFAELPGLREAHGARAFTGIVILAGIGAVAYLQSSMTALLVEGAIGQAWRRNRMRSSIESLSGHVVVAGVGSTGRFVIQELLATSTPFVAIDRSLENLQRISQELAGGRLLFVHGDATTDEALKAAGVERAAGIVAALSDDKDNLFVTLSARSMSPVVRIVARVIDPDAVPKMTRAGANGTVNPNMIGGLRMASEIIRPEVTEFLDEMLRDREKKLRLEEVIVPLDSPLVGRPLRDAAIRRESNVLVVAVRGQDRKFLYNPGPDHVLEGGTVLVVLGEAHEVRKLRAFQGSIGRPPAFRSS